MKNSYLIAVITLTIGTFSINIGSESSSTASGSLISQSKSAVYNIYQGMINSFTRLANMPYSIMNSFDTWSNQRKIFLTTATMASLLIIYQKERIKRWLNSLIERAISSEETRGALQSTNVEEIPWDENYKKRIKEGLGE